MTFFVPVPRQVRVLAGGLFACSCCRVQLFATLWTVAHQASLSMGFFRQEYWSGLPFPFDGAVTVMSFQSCPTLCDPIDGSPPGSPVPGILQARTLEWVAISFSNAWKWKVKEKSLSRVRLLATPWTAAHQAPLPMGFSRQGYWSGVPFPLDGEGLFNSSLHSLWSSTFHHFVES